MTGRSREICHRCGGKLERGSAHIGDRAPGLISFLPWRTQLYFQPKDPTLEEIRFLAWPKKHTAFHCLGCGGVVVTKHPHHTNHPSDATEVEP